MVYHGKPSSGCARCKQRRKKCDETRPHCLNCQRIGHDCPGYPDKLDIMFKNETDTVVRRAQKRTRSTGTTPNSVSPTSPLSPQERARNLSLPELSLGPQAGEASNSRGTTADTLYNLSIRSDDLGTQALARSSRPVDELDHLVCPEGCCLSPLSMTFNPSIEEQVTQFFFGHFRPASNTVIVTHGIVSILLPRIDTLTSESPLLMASQAIAMRLVGICHGREEFAPRANALYCRAMSSIQGWIEDPVLCMQDDTLLAVLLFSMYESIAGTSLKNWSDHVHGAANIVRARGAMLQEAGVPQLLFRAVRANVLTDALRQSESMPELPGARTWLEAEGIASGSHALERFVRLSHLRAELKRLLRSIRSDMSISAVEDSIGQVFQLQEEFSKGQDCSQLGCECVTIVHWCNTYETHTGQEPDPDIHDGVHVSQRLHEDAVRRHNQIGQLHSAQMVAQACEWLNPQTYQSDERFQVASLWTEYMSEIVESGRPPYLSYHSSLSDREHEGMATQTNRPALGLLQAAHSLCIPPLHWALMTPDTEFEELAMSG